MKPRVGERVWEGKTPNRLVRRKQKSDLMGQIFCRSIAKRTDWHFEKMPCPWRGQLQEKRPGRGRLFSCSRPGGSGRDGRLQAPSESVVRFDTKCQNSTNVTLLERVTEMWYNFLSENYTTCPTMSDNI